MAASKLSNEGTNKRRTRRSKTVQILVRMKMRFWPKEAALAVGFFGTDSDLVPAINEVRIEAFERKQEVKNAC